MKWFRAPYLPFVTTMCDKGFNQQSVVKYSYMTKYRKYRPRSNVITLKRDAEDRSSTSYLAVIEERRLSAETHIKVK